MSTVETRQQMWKDVYGNINDKEAELAGTYDMPHATRQAAPGKPKAVIEKTAAEQEDDFFKNLFGVEEEKTAAVDPEIATRAERFLKPHVNVTGKEPTSPVTEKKAARYALPADERYPLDGYDQVKEASAYFDEFQREMPPEVRREYCRNMVKRAYELGIGTSETAQSYGADSYAPTAHIKIALDMRRELIDNEEHLAVLDKIANVRAVVLPEDYAELLRGFDKMAGLTDFYDAKLLDPYLSTFGKSAAVLKEDAEGAVLVGSEYAKMSDLVRFANMGGKALKSRFGDDFVNAFAKSPKATFDAMPKDQKLILIRMMRTQSNATIG